MLPLLLFLSLIVAEGANFIRVHQVINNAAREGVRLSVLPENAGHTTDIVNAVVTYATANYVPITSANVTILQNRTMVLASGISAGTSQVTVSYAYPLTYLPKLPWFTVAKSIQLKAAAEFRNFY